MVCFVCDGFENEVLKGFVCVSSGGYFGVGIFVFGWSWGVLCVELKVFLCYVFLFFWNY